MKRTWIKLVNGSEFEVPPDVIGGGDMVEVLKGAALGPDKFLSVIQIAGDEQDPNAQRSEVHIRTSMIVEIKFEQDWQSRDW
jgi:hypothetical protein